MAAVDADVRTGTLAALARVRWQIDDVLLSVRVLLQSVTAKQRVHGTG